MRFIVPSIIPGKNHFFEQAFQEYGLAEYARVWHVRPHQSLCLWCFDVFFADLKVLSKFIVAYMDVSVLHIIRAVQRAYADLSRNAETYVYFEELQGSVEDVP